MAKNKPIKPVSTIKAPKPPAGARKRNNVYKAVRVGKTELPIKAAPRGKVTEKTKANLKSWKPGCPTPNPAGRAGKDGKGGLTLTGIWQRTMASLSEDDQEALLLGLMAKVRMGDVQAIRLAADLNKELIGAASMLNQAIEDNGVRVIVSMPPRETREDK